jgi:plastocyanin
VRKLHGTVLALAAVGLVTAACTSSSSSTSSTTTTSTSTSTASTPQSTGGGGGGATSAEIEAEDFAFSPDSVDVSAGTVTLTVSNKDSTEHTFTLDDGSSNTDLPPGSTEKITLDLTKTVGWHCTIHPSMTGTLNVG